MGAVEVHLPSFLTSALGTEVNFPSRLLYNPEKKPPKLAEQKANWASTACTDASERGGTLFTLP
jgi:hypothetical protein